MATYSVPIGLRDKLASVKENKQWSSLQKNRELLHETLIWYYPEMMYYITNNLTPTVLFQILDNTIREINLYYGGKLVRFLELNLVKESKDAYVFTTLFHWEDTPQGYQYWSDIEFKIRSRSSYP